MQCLWRCKIVFMKIAIVKLSALGDIVHSMIILQFIKNCHQKIEVDWIVEESCKGLLEFNPQVNNVHVLNLKYAKINKSLSLFIKELRKVKNFGPYDLVIDMQGIIKSALITRLIPSINKIGFDKSSIRESLASNFYNQKYKIDYARNILDRNIGIINFALSLNINYKNILDKKPFLYSNKVYEFKQLSKDKKNILLVPGASFDSKCYPPEKYGELSKNIEANFLVIWGNERERVLAQKIKFFAPNVRIVDKLSLNLLISLVSNIDLIIGSDTGPTHFAWALNIPSITLFGPTPGYRNTFPTPINKFLESKSVVDPYKINKKDFSIKNIKVNDIVKIAEYLLKL